MIDASKIIAHRGAWKDFGLPQNSLAAFQKAQELPIDGIEMDIQLTADEHLVVYHDDFVAGKLISTINWEEIRQHRLSDGREIPHFTDFLEVWNKEKRLVIELKDAQLSSEQKLKFVEIFLHQLNKQTDHLQVISFDLELLQMLIKLSILPCFYLGDEYSPKELKSFHFAGYDANFETLIKTPELIASCHKNQLQVNSWTVNSLEIASKLQELNVDFLTSDELKLLIGN